MGGRSKCITLGTISDETPARKLEMVAELSATVRQLLLVGLAAVSYTHLTLPTNREV